MSTCLTYTMANMHVLQEPPAHRFFEKNRAVFLRVAQLATDECADQ